MSPEFVQTVFEPFTRERSSTVSGIQGTGLGMSITKNIVDLMGGAIDVTSEVGKGTEFVVTFTFQLAEVSCEQADLVALAGQRVLVVDDDEEVCRSAERMLRAVGLRAAWTTSGEEALSLTEKALKDNDPYRVYIVDWVMPGMNGVETTRCLRKLVGEDVPVIILSAYDWSDIVEEAREAGATDFLGKPLFASDLRRALLRACAQEAEQPEEVPAAEEPHFEGYRILLAEDNELNREIATVILEEAGLEVDCAENGQQVCDMLAASQPGDYALILMDVQMPVMDGHEAAKRIRRLENRDLANIPIIAMTANAFEEDKQAALAAGMNGHLGKPIDIPELMATLSRILRAG